MKTVLSLVAVSLVVMTSRDVHTYAFRWRSTLLPLATPLVCPDVSMLEEPHAAGATADTDALAHVLDYVCDTGTHLAALVQHVTTGATNDLERGLQWLSYVQRVLVPAALPVVDADGTAIYHPLRLLERRSGDCSQTARLLVDGLMAIGIPARLLQMDGHVSTEFQAGGKWRFAEAHLLGDGEFVADATGQPASLDDILRAPALLDGVHPYPDVIERGELEHARFRAVFAPVVYPQSPLITPYVIKKIAAPVERRLRVLFWLNGRLDAERALADEHHYGWNHYVFCGRHEPGCFN